MVLTPAVVSVSPLLWVSKNHHLASGQNRAWVPEPETGKHIVGMGRGLPVSSCLTHLRTGDQEKCQVWESITAYGKRGLASNAVLLLLCSCPSSLSETFFPRPWSEGGKMEG